MKYSQNHSPKSSRNNERVLLQPSGSKNQTGKTKKYSDPLQPVKKCSRTSRSKTCLLCATPTTSSSRSVCLWTDASWPSLWRGMRPAERSWVRSWRAMRLPCSRMCWSKRTRNPTGSRSGWTWSGRWKIGSMVLSMLLTRPMKIPNPRRLQRRSRYRQCLFISQGQQNRLK